MTEEPKALSKEKEVFITDTSMCRCITLDAPDGKVIVESRQKTDTLQQLKEVAFAGLDKIREKKTGVQRYLQ